MRVGGFCRGIIPRSFRHIFDSINGLGKDKEYLVRASFLEIYNEDVRDLLSKNPSNKLELKESVDTGEARTNHNPLYSTSARCVVYVEVRFAQVGFRFAQACTSRTSRASWSRASRRSTTCSPSARRIAPSAPPL